YRVLPVSGCASCLADNIDAFPEVNRTALAEKMLEPHIGAFAALARNIDKFPELNHARLVECFLRSNPDYQEGHDFLRHLFKLRGVDSFHVAEVLIEKDPMTAACLIYEFKSLGGSQRHFLAERFRARGEQFAVLALILNKRFPRDDDFFTGASFKPDPRWGIRDQLALHGSLLPSQIPYLLSNPAQVIENWESAPKQYLELVFRRFWSLPQPDRIMRQLVDSPTARELCRELPHFTPRASDAHVLPLLAEAGFHERVLRILGHYSFLEPTQVKLIFKAVAKGYVLEGHFQKARDLLSRHGISEMDFNSYIVSEIAQDLEDENIVALCGVAAWLSDRPEAAALLDNLAIRDGFKKYLDAFPSNKDSTGYRNSSSEQFIREGIALLAGLTLFQPAHVEAILDALPTFFQRGASTAAAWAVHRENVGPELISRAMADLSPPLVVYKLEEDLPTMMTIFTDKENCSKTGLDTQPAPPDPKAELADLLSFFCDYSSIRAPALYSEFRARKRASLPLGELGPKEIAHRTQAMLRELLADKALSPLSDIEWELLAAVVGGPPDKVRSITKTFYEDIERERVKPLDPRLKDKTYQFTADRLSSKSAETFIFSDTSTGLYKTFTDIILNSATIDLDVVLDHKKEAAISRLAFISQENEKKISEVPKGRAHNLELRRVAIQNALEALQNVNSMYSLLVTLCEHATVDKELKKYVREVAGSLALRDTRLDVGWISALSSPVPTQEAVERLSELIQEHVLHNRALVEPLGKRASVLRAAMNTASFEEDLHRLQKLGTHGSEKLLAVPTRGLLGALSGFICDVCWSRQVDLMQRYPHATGLIFVKNHDNPVTARLEGGCMLIAVKDNDNQDVLVINGLNPTQNLIVGLNAQSFFEKFLEEVVIPIATDLNIKKIAIPTTVPGSFFEPRSNRPSLARYLTERCKNLPRITFEKDRDRAVFNDNSFEKNCVVLWSAPT
ncbi:MAG: hypothetical protein RL518_2469, partial [Pseudomonadota bacterium]